MTEITQRTVKDRYDEILGMDSDDRGHLDVSTLLELENDLVREGYAVADTDKAAFDRLKHDCFKDIGESWICSLGRHSSDPDKTDFHALIEIARKEFIQGGGLDKFGLTDEDWESAAEEPFDTKNKDALGKPDANGKSPHHT